MTDGHIWLAEDGEWRRQFFIRDGMGIVMLRETGMKFAVITTSDADDIRARVKNLKIDYFFEGIKNKADAFEKLLEQSGLDAHEIAFVGDDVIDLPIFDLCGWSVAPADAHPKVLKKADYVTRARGGKGAVREVCDLLMKIQK
jgi:3-deoxy-D-manno-octulosonate 8-phosphate phosphatase (KDO 8-P phosphatase)